VRQNELQALTVRLPKDLHRALRVRAAVEGRSVAAVITDLVRSYLAEHQTDELPSAPEEPEDE